MRSSRLFLVVWLTGWLCHAARAEDDFATSLRLRGGFDSNPQFSSARGASSGFVGTDVALAAGTKEKDYSYGVAAESGATQYLNPTLTPAINGRVVLRGAYGDDAANISAISTIADTNTYNLRSSDLIQSFKAEATLDTVKVFATVEGARSSLNQTNAIFQDFLPAPQVYLRGTFIPGVAYVRGKLEVGTSLNLSVRRYDKELDDFGYRRDNERMQPYLFAKYEDKDLTLFASISQLRGTFHDVDFTNLNTTLFDGKLNWRVGPVLIDLAAFRRASETTFPISPITIDTAYTAKASWQIDPKWMLTAATGYAETKYLDSIFNARTLTYGIGASRDLGNHYALGFDIARAQGVLISGDRVDAMIVTSSLTKSFAPSPKTPVASNAPNEKKAATKG